MESALQGREQGADAPGHSTTGAVGSAERLWDALALLMILSGTTLFMLARNGLDSIAAGTHKLPPGVPSFVARAAEFSAQSALGLGMIGLGVVVGLVSSVRHAARRPRRRESSAISHQPSA